MILHDRTRLIVCFRIIIFSLFSVKKIKDSPRTGEHTENTEKEFSPSCLCVFVANFMVAIQDGAPSPETMKILSVNVLCKSVANLFS